MWRPWARKEWTIEEWRERLDRARRKVDRNLDQLGHAGLSERWEIYVFLRDDLENVEFCDIGLTVALGQDFEDLGWIHRRTEQALTRLAVLEGSTERRDRAQIQGQRKIVRKWREQIAYTEMLKQVDLAKAFGQDPEPLIAAFRTWFRRPDRKSFDGNAWFDEHVVLWQEGRRARWSAEQAARAAGTS